MAKRLANLRWRAAQAAEILWWRQYLKRKPPEAYLAQKKAYWERLLSEQGMGAPEGAEVLDAGCGPAGVFMVLGGAKVTALDPLLDRYAALPHFAEADYPGVAFRQQALEALNEEARYDLIYCLNAINHVKSLDRSLASLYRSLKPGGTCWLSTDAHHFPWLQPVFAALPGDILHPHQFTQEQYLRRLLRAGFAIKGQRLLKRDGLFDYWLFELVKR
ncbi:class I SAM-dependent methyltransferase [Phaeodactylibacter luteus]|nr:class I SAM-dependent methyltransferase [Phaeodactylibacter luteus]